MRLWAVTCENFANFGTLTVWDWVVITGVTALYVYVRYKWFL